MKSLLSATAAVAALNQLPSMITNAKGEWNGPREVQAEREGAIRSLMRIAEHRKVWLDTPALTTVSRQVHRRQALDAWKASGRVTPRPTGVPA